MKSLLNRPLVCLALVFAPGVWWGVEHPAFRGAYAIVGWTFIGIAAVVCLALYMADKRLGDSSSLPRYLRVAFWINAVAAMAVIAMCLGARAISPPLAENHISRWIAPTDSPRKESMIIVEGRLDESPRKYPDRTYLYLEAERVYKGDRYYPVYGRVRVTVMKNCPRLYYGDRIQFRLTLKGAKNFSNPGSFDYEQYLAAQGIFARGYIKDGESIVIMRGLHAPRGGVLRMVEVNYYRLKAVALLIGYKPTKDRRQP